MSFGLTLTNSAGRDIPVRWIGEQHVREDCQGRIPSMADWLRRIQPEPWMANGHIDRHSGDEPCGDPRAAWASEVAAGRTVLGLEGLDGGARDAKPRKVPDRSLGRLPNECCMEARLDDRASCVVSPPFFVRRFA